MFKFRNKKNFPRLAVMFFAFDGDVYTLSDENSEEKLARWEISTL